MTYTEPNAPIHLPSESMNEGDDFVCPNCACEIRLRHAGDPARMAQVGPFVCSCGTQMVKETRSA